MNTRHKHIVIICSRLDQPGGTERAVINAANLFSSKGNKVTILILDETEKSFFPISNSIPVYNYALHFGITSKGNIISRKIALLKHLRILKKKIEGLSPDIIITTEYHLTIAAGLVAKNIPVFSWEHHHFYWLKRNIFWNFLHRNIYPRINSVVVLNKTEQELFLNYGCNAIVIPNFVSQQSKAELNNRTLLSVGWLNWRKGVDLIPGIAKKVFEKHKDWQWNIIGSGDRETELRKALAEQNLDQNVKIFPPVSDNISEVYKQASLLIMTSRFECFPMVLLEAMSFGVPCIAFDCPTGPSDIIQNGIDGKLVEQENIPAIANAIMQLIEDETKRKIMGANAFENIKRFSSEAVYQLWEMLFNDDKNHRRHK